MASFAYGYPPNKFQVYLHPDWIDDEKAGALREELRKFQVFKEGGNYTLRTFVKQRQYNQIEGDLSVYCRTSERTYSRLSER